VAPKPEQWPAPLVRVKELVATNKGLSPEELRAVKAPALIVTGDRDVMTLEHTISLYRLLPKAELAVFPGTDHFPGIVNRSQWTLAIVPAFLDAQIAEAK
jgi:pimeloyl-ACP methyl ester carboxylesterase